MSYIGSTPTTQSFIAGTDYFNGTGAQVAFTLSRSVNSVNDIEVIVNNVEQIPSGYSVSGTTLTFSAAPSAGTSNVYVRYLSTTNLSLAIPAGTSASFNTVTATNLTSTNGASIQGLTVGRGAGAVASNTVLGTGSLNANTSGTSNTAVGNTALQANTTGISNTAVGELALLLNTTGGTNTAIGRAALQANTTASDNTAVGKFALLSNTTGANNAAMGSGALQANTTASRNTAVGYQAGYANTTGTRNTGVGAYSLNVATTGNYNTAIGDVALEGVTTGSANTVIGIGSGGAITTGNNNTIIGAYTGNQGGLDIRTASNYIVLSDGDGNPRQVITSAGVIQAGPTGTAEMFAQNTVKVWGAINSGSGTFYNSFGASSISKTSSGLFQINFSRTFASARFGMAGAGYGNATIVSGGAESTTGTSIRAFTNSGSLTDTDFQFLIAGSS